MKYKKQLISFTGNLRSSIYTILSILLAGTLLFVYSCSKEVIKGENQNQPPQTAYESELFKAVKDFKQKVVDYQENGMYKNSETVSTGDALLLLEGTMNSSHAFTMDLYDEVLVEDLTLAVPKNGDGEVDMVVLLQKYLDMKADITTVYYASSFENKGLVAVDLTETEQNSDEITYNVGVITGNRGNEPPPGGFGVDGPFNDNWWYGEYAGSCDGIWTDLDAAQIIKTAMTKYINDYNEDHGIYYFYPVHTHYFAGGDNKLRRPNDVEDNHLDYYMYYADTAIGISDDTLCVEIPEGNLYYQYLKYWLYTKMKDSLQSVNSLCYQPAEILWMEGDYLNGQYLHYGWFLFGKPQIYGEPPEEL